MGEDFEPLYHEVSKKKVLFARIFGVVTAIMVLLAIIFSLVQGHKRSTLYLCVVNLILSSVVASILAWWYHNGVLQARAYTFMIFVGICVVFQAIVIDIFVWNWQPIGTDVIPVINPHTMSPANHSTTPHPHLSS